VVNRQSSIANRQSVQTGADQLRAGGFARLRGRRVGLLTNPAGVTADLTSLVDLLATADGVELVALFGPEHGLSASAEAGAEVGEATHPRHGTPIHSLYGARQAPTEESLAGLDLLVIDLPDIGVRFFTYNATVALTLEVCARVGLPVLLLDRPNPIGGLVVEGPMLDPAQTSFVGMLPIPIRHELALLANDTQGYGAELEVLPVQGWRRDMLYPATGLPWVTPSPNIPTLATAVVYPGTCLFEGTMLTEGRGTTLPFELIGAPWLDADQLAADLNALALPGLRWRPAAFTPSSYGRLYVGQVCYGVQPHPTDPVALRPVTAALHLLAAARRLAPDHHGWREPWAPGSQLPIDLLSGSTALREAFDADVPVAEIVASWDAELARYRERCRAWMLYE
jgi:uncharacterized protein YbbC (DUF1343 family)